MLGVFRLKTANTIGLLPTRRLLRDFPRGLQSVREVNQPVAKGGQSIWQRIQESGARSRPQ